ncbi:MAG: alpha/beta hydrolase [Acidiferrobacterales bacterium]|nr:alpha/beta hydrolase [Acidiferrobacterales bacterium]
MSAEILYRGYDRTGLDTQYNARAAVPEHVEYVERWQREGVATLQAYPHELDIAYGPNVAEKLDVFPAGNATPVLVYIHGGYWMSRDKADFRFLANTFVPAGAAFVPINYALIPSVNMDELVRQCRAALAWVFRHAASFGGNPERIYISGHSAGGHLVAMMMTTDWRRFSSLPQDLIKGACAISGIYDLEPIPLCYLHDTLHLSTGEVERNSPVRLMARSHNPLIVAYGELESDEFRRQSGDFANAWQERRVDCQVIPCPAKNHFTIVDHFADRDSALAQAVMAQMELA